MKGHTLSSEVTGDYSSQMPENAATNAKAKNAVSQFVSYILITCRDAGVHQPCSVQAEISALHCVPMLALKNKT